MDVRSTIIMETPAGRRVYLPGGRADRCFAARDVDGIVARMRAMRAPADAVDGAVASLDGQDPESDVAVFVISTKRVDSYNTTIAPDGWLLEDYAANPVVLFAHDQDGLPVARDIGRFIDRERLVGTAMFATRELNPFGHQVGRLVRAGFLNTASVGFEPVEVEESKERGRESTPFAPLDFRKQRLVEWSIVPVPANADCLAQDRSGMSALEVRSALGAIIDHGFVSGFARDAIETVRRHFGAAPVIVPAGDTMAAPKEAPKPVDGVQSRSTPGHEKLEPEVEETPPSDPLEDGKRAPAMLVCPACGHEADAAMFAPASEEGEPAADLEEKTYSEEDMQRIAAEVATRASEVAAERAVEAALIKFRKEFLGRLD